MPRALAARRIPMRRPQRPPHGPAGAATVRTSHLVLALLGVVLLGGLALAAAFALASGATTP